MFCTTADVQTVESCLIEKLGPYDPDQPAFQCFNAVAAMEGVGKKMSLKKDMLILLGLSIFVAASGMV